MSEVHLVPKDLYYHEVAYVRRLEALAQAVRDWHTTQTEYLITCDMALSTHAPSEGSERYRAEKAAAALAASNMVAALHKLETR